VKGRRALLIGKVDENRRQIAMADALRAPGSS